MSLSGLKRVGVALALLPALAACENSATAYMVDGNQHALILVREKTYFWDSTVKQAMIASRLPNCQRRVDIHPGQDALEPMAVYEAGDRLWALHQGARWYLATTSTCQVQDWANASGSPPGSLVGTFQLKNDAPTFVPAGG